MKNIAVITARSGSKGLRDKNIKPLNGRPMLAYSIEAAIASGVFDTVYVSTDSEKYAEIARAYGADVPFLRSAENATDTAASMSAVFEALEGYRQLGRTYETVMLLQPTSPLRTAEDIRGAYQVMREKGAKTVVSVCEAEHSPLWCSTLPETMCMDGFCGPEARAPRQALGKYYRLNGAIFLFDIPALEKWGDLVYGPECYAYVMPRERSLDIDEPMDFLMAEALLNR